MTLPTVKEPRDSTCMNEDEWASLVELATLMFTVEGGENVTLVFGENTRTAGYVMMFPDEPAYIVYDEIAAPFVRQVKQEFSDD